MSDSCHIHSSHNVHAISFRYLFLLKVFIPQIVFLLFNVTLIRYVFIRIEMETLSSYFVLPNYIQKYVCCMFHLSDSDSHPRSSTGCAREQIPGAEPVHICGDGRG